MGNNFEDDIKKMDLGELYSYYTITKNIGRIVKVLGISTALVMVSFFSVLTVIPCVAFLYILSQTDVAVDYTKSVIGLQILKLADK